MSGALADESPPSDLHRPTGIRIRDLVVQYAPGEYDSEKAIIDRLNLEVQPGEIVALVGASGCGKSTLLRAIAGLVPLQSGAIEFDMAESESQPELSFVFQDATLLPWRTVCENVLLPIELSGSARDCRRELKKLAQAAVRLASSSQRVADDGETAPNQLLDQQPLAATLSLESTSSRGLAGSATLERTLSERIAAVLTAVGLEPESWNRFPRELSGGMRMRTSIARALLTDPRLLLLDEPFAALDDLLRNRLNDLLLELWRHRQRTIIFVTHNIAEAVYLSHRVAVFGRGKIDSIIENSLPFPRSPEQRTSVEFAQLYGKVSTALAEAAE